MGPDRGQGVPVPFAMGPPGGDWAGSRGAAGTATSCYFLAPHPQQEHVPVLQQGAAGAQAHPCPPGLQPHSVLQQVLQQGSVMVVAVLGGEGKGAVSIRTELRIVSVRETWNSVERFRVRDF